MIGRIKFALVIVLAITFGCKTAPNNQPSFSDIAAVGVEDYLHQSLRPQNPNINIVSEHQFDTAPLENFNFSDESKFIRLSLDQCIENALRDSEVIRELGGTVLRSPELIRTDDDPARIYTDPRFGEEAALSEFDAVFSNQLLYQNNDRAFNSSFIGDQGILTQDLATNITNLTKRSATGGLFQINHQVIYDRNNTPANRFSNNTSYDSFLAAEFRQPLLQGGGVLFNRIAGPNNLPGVNNGVLIARTNTDISLADFELGIRNVVSDVENAYWDLYFAYRDLEAKIEARNGAYQIWKRAEAKVDELGSVQVQQAEEQYYLFASRVENAIHGQLNDGTRTNNGSSSGTFRANSGVRTAERRLRLLTGLAVNDAMLIVPSDMPVEADLVFDWEQSKSDALNNRTELRRQQWVLKREQLNYLANKNQLLPRLDLIGRYRIRGFGNDLFGNDGFDPGTPFGVDPQNGSDAFATFLNGDLQEWELGMDVNIPIGFRRQIAAVRNSELNYTREKKILHEQEREIIYGLSNALGELRRASSLIDVNSRRLDASKRQYEAIQQSFVESDNTTIDLVLESQRRVIDAKLDYFRTQVELMLAIKAIHFEKGTMLNYHNVSLSEKGWTNKAVCDASARELSKSDVIDYACPGIKVSNPISEAPMGYTSGESFLMSTNDSDDKDANPEKKSDIQIAKKLLGTSNTPSEILGTTGDVWTNLADNDSGDVLMSIAKHMEAEEANSVKEKLADTPNAAKSSDKSNATDNSFASKAAEVINSLAGSSLAKTDSTTSPTKNAIGSGLVAAKNVTLKTTMPKTTVPQNTTLSQSVAKKADPKATLPALATKTPTITKPIVAMNPKSNSVATTTLPPMKTTPLPVVKNPNIVYQQTKQSPMASRLKNQVRSLYDPSLNRRAKSVTPMGLPKSLKLPRVVKAQTSSTPANQTAVTSVQSKAAVTSKPTEQQTAAAQKKPVVKPQTNAPGARVSSLPSQKTSSRRR